MYNVRKLYSCLYIENNSSYCSPSYYHLIMNMRFVIEHFVQTSVNGMMNMKSTRFHVKTSLTPRRVFGSTKIVMKCIQRTTIEFLPIHARYSPTRLFPILSEKRTVKIVAARAPITSRG